MCLADGAVDRSRCPPGDVQHPAAVALPRRQLPNHHNQRGDAINEHNAHDCPEYYRRHVDDFDRAIKYYDDCQHGGEYDICADNVLAAVRAVFDAAAAVLAVDVAVDSAGDGVSGPADNTVRRLRDTDDDGHLWRLLDSYIDLPTTRNQLALRDAIATRYGH